jgi:NDP-sugar pyrophosphorylase family protein
VKYLGDNCVPIDGEQGYSPEELRVLIPVGGRATRLLPLTAETSKACLRLLNRPLVEFSLLSLASQGIRNIIFGVKGYTNYRDLYDYFGSGYGFSARYNIKPRLHIDYQPNVDDLGSADSARINMEYYDLKSTIFAVQGDNIFDVNIKSLMDFHKKKSAALTIVLREVDNIEGLGLADINKDGRINRFVEKPLPKEAPSNLANTGLYVMSPKVRQIFKEAGVQQIVRDKKRLDFGYDFIPYVIQSGWPVYGYTIKSNWFDVGTPKNYLEAMKSLLQQHNRTMPEDFGKCIQTDSEGLVWIQGKSSISEKCREQIIQKIKQKKIHVNGVVLIGRHCQIEDGVTLTNCCLDNFVRVGKNVIVSDSAVMDRSVIGDYTAVTDSILGRHVIVCSSQNKMTKISDVSVVADDVIIEEGSLLSASKIYPHQKVQGEFSNQTVLTPVKL